MRWTAASISMAFGRYFVGCFLLRDCRGRRTVCAVPVGNKIIYAVYRIGTRYCAQYAGRYQSAFSLGLSE